VRQFDEVWANFCDTKFCVDVANEMESIELGLRALSIGPGDEVVTKPMTAIATVPTIMHAGATPVPAEVAIVIQHQNVLTVKTTCVAARLRSWF
jgi:dTDP-4-amino-4,6-dideoxygalactose transaminase